MDTAVVLVDENDNVIGTKSRPALSPTDINRVSILWIENAQGEVLLQQRSQTKKLGPGQWGPAVAGTVEADETYQSNIIKEAQEEIGLKLVDFIELQKRLYWEPEGFGRMFMFFKAIVQKAATDFTIQPDEVAQLQWEDKSHLLTQVKSYPERYVPSATLWEEVYY